MNFLYLTPLILLLLIPSAYAYRGDTYTDIENPDGTHTWTGGLPLWLPTEQRDSSGRTVYTHYLVSDQPTYVSVQNGEASFVFDKTTCSAKIYKGGLVNDSNDFILGSDSYVPKSSVDGSGTWSIVNSVNNAACITTIEETPTSIKITGTKSSSAGIFKVSYLKEDGKPLKTILEATNLTSLTDRRFGVTQTQSIPQIIKWAGQERDLANHVGQTFDRTWLENNKNNLSNLFVYGDIKFNVIDAWDQLNSITVNSVSNGMASISFNYLRNTPILMPGQTLVIDPTYSSNNPTVDGFATSAATTGAACSTTGNTWTTGTATLLVLIYPTTDNQVCYRVAVEYDLSSLPASITVTNSSFAYDNNAVNGVGGDCAFTAMTVQPSSGATADQIYDNIASSTVMATSSTCASSGPNKDVDLGANGDSYFASQAASGWASIGIKMASEVRDASQHGVEIAAEEDAAATPKPTLTITYLIPCAAPTNLSAKTQNTTSINLSWTAPSPDCNATNYKVFESKSGGTYTLKETLGNVTSTGYNTLDSATLYAYMVSAANGAGYLYNSTVATNATIPSAPTSLVSTPVSKAQINTDYSENSVGSYIQWFKSRYAVCSGGSWNNFHTNSSVNTPRYENFTGLGEGIQYCMQIASGNIGGFGDWSSNSTAKTFATTTGSNTGTLLNIGDVLNGTSVVTITAASPSPVLVSQVEILANGTAVKTITTSESINDGQSATFGPYYYYIPDDDPYSYQIRVTVSNNTGTLQFTSSATDLSREYNPEYFEALDPTQGFVNYTISRTANQEEIILKTNRDESGNTFNIECLYRSMTDAALNTGGTWHNYTSVGYMNDTLYDAAGTHYYIDCYNDGLLFQVVSYTNSSMLLAGIEVFDNTYGTFIGVPVGVFFIVLVAGMANQRTAPMWIVVILAIAGIMSAIGFFTLETNVWALALIAALLGIIVGRKLF